MQTVCTFCVGIGGLTVKIGRLVADLDQGKRAPLLGLDLAALIPVVRDAEGRTDVIAAAGRPYPEIVHPPLLNHDAVYDRTKTERKLGWVNTDEDEGGVVYRVRLNVAAVKKLYDPVWVHLTDSEKEKGEMK